MTNVIASWDASQSKAGWAWMGVWEVGDGQRRLLSHWQFCLSQWGFRHCAGLGMGYSVNSKGVPVPLRVLKLGLLEMTIFKMWLHSILCKVKNSGHLINIRYFRADLLWKKTTGFFWHFCNWNKSPAQHDTLSPETCVSGKNVWKQNLHYRIPQLQIMHFFQPKSNISLISLMSTHKICFPGDIRKILHGYSKTCVRQPPLKLTLVVDVERWLSYKGKCQVILLAKLHDMYLYKTDNFFHINHYLKSVLKVALLHRFYCTLLVWSYGIHVPSSNNTRWQWWIIF